MGPKSHFQTSLYRDPANSGDQVSTRCTKTTSSWWSSVYKVHRNNKSL